MAQRKSYQHSKTFDNLKGIKEQVGENYTSLQYLHTLDMFLWNALTPIQSECPSLFNNYMAKITAHQSIKASTKFSSDDRAKLPIHLFNMVTANDFRHSYDSARAMFINRGLLFGFIAMFLKRMAYYEQLHSPLLKMDSMKRATEIYKVERSIGLRANGSLYAAIQQVHHWHEKALWWKGAILEKYTRRALGEAQRTYKDYNHYVELDDVVQIYLMVTERAINRCDARQGVLTTFIENWFKSARSAVANLAKGQTDQSIEQLIEEHGDAASDIVGFTMPDTNGELMEHVAFLAKKYDKFGYVRAPMGIPEFLSRDQRQVLEQFVLEA
jgi:hypothetical protein